MSRHSFRLRVRSFILWVAVVVCGLTAPGQAQTGSAPAPIFEKGRLPAGNAARVPLPALSLTRDAAGAGTVNRRTWKGHRWRDTESVNARQRSPAARPGSLARGIAWLQRYNWRPE